jgi:hypothetical protein
MGAGIRSVSLGLHSTRHVIHSVEGHDEVPRDGIDGKDECGSESGGANVDTNGGIGGKVRGRGDSEDDGEGSGDIQGQGPQDGAEHGGRVDQA